MSEIKRTIFLDRFTAGLDDLTRKQQRSMVEVLKCLDKIKRFSVFEATANQYIAKTMDWLVKNKLIETDISCGYPWTNVTITELGRQRMEAGQ